VTDEDKRQTRFTLLLSLLLAAAVLGSLAWQRDAYAHPMPEKDCSRPSEYPICSRATQPPPAQEPPAAKRYLGLVLALILGILLTVASLKSSVMRQETIVAPGAKTAPVLSPPSGTKPIAQNAPLSAPPPPPARSALWPATLTQEPKTPPAIIDNKILPEMVVKGQAVSAPSAKPAQGVDPKTLEAPRG
jgi:hypothetical protein